MQADPLSEVLSLLKPHTHVAGGLDLGGDWAVDYDPHSGIKCYAILSGAAWLAVEGEVEPVRLEAGDCVLLPNGRRFRIARDLAFVPLQFRDLPRGDWLGGIATVGGGGDTVLLAGHFAFSGARTDLLLGAMPPIVRLRDPDDRDGLRWALERLCRELKDKRPGGALVARHLAHMMLVQALRMYIAQGVGRHVGWLFALAEPKIGAAIGAIHAAPGAHWTLAALAGEAGMSRSAFARVFKEVAGTAPIDYLTHWRMLLACERLQGGSEPVATIAAALGYASESAFSTAFKRVMGCAPRRYGVGCAPRAHQADN